MNEAINVYNCMAVSATYIKSGFIYYFILFIMILISIFDIISVNLIVIFVVMRAIITIFFTLGWK